MAAQLHQAVTAKLAMEDHCQYVPRYANIEVERGQPVRCQDPYPI